MHDPAGCTRGLPRNSFDSPSDTAEPPGLREWRAGMFYRRGRRQRARAHTRRPANYTLHTAADKLPLRSILELTTKPAPACGVAAAFSRAPLTRKY